MRIEIGARYRTRNGRITEIAGVTKVNPEWFWSTAGDWYDAAGSYLGYSPTTFEHAPVPDAPLTLVRQLK